MPVIRGERVEFHGDVTMGAEMIGYLEPKIMGGFSCWPRFDPKAYWKDIKTNPHNYVRGSSLVAELEATMPIRKATTLEGLREAFKAQTRAFKGNAEMLAALTEAKDKRKGELTNV